MFVTLPFWTDLLRKIEPTKSQKARAKRTHEVLRHVLNTGHMARRLLTSYLSGSYARRTAIRPQDDVDIIFMIDPAYWPARFLSPHPDPRDTLESFARAIRYRYKDNRVVIQHRSVRLEFPELCIDAVPAIQDGTDHEFIFVPNVDEDDVFVEDWIPSRPLKHARIVADLNGKNNGQFTPLVKILKYWNSRVPETRQFKSFAVETIAATVLQHSSITSYDAALLLVFDFIAFTAGKDTLHKWSDHYGIHLDVDTIWSLNIPDLGGSGSNLAARTKNQRCAGFVSEATRSRDLIQQSMNYKTPEAASDSIRAAFRI